MISRRDFDQVAKQLAMLRREAEKISRRVEIAGGFRALRENREWQALLGSPGLRQASELGRMLRANPALEALQQLEKLQRLSQSVSELPAIHVVEKLQRRQLDFRRAAGLDRIQDIGRNLRAFEDIVGFRSTVPAAAALGTIVSRAAELAEEPGNFEGEDDLERALEDVEREVGESLESGPAAPHARALYMDRLLAAIQIALTVLDIALRSSPALQTKFEELVASIEVHIESASAECSSGLQFDLYKVDRETTISEKPRPRSTVVARLQPNELVHVTDRKGCWVEVVYVEGGAEHSGWTRKKYLSR